jgi:hypothetical protein
LSFFTPADNFAALFFGKVGHDAGRAGGAAHCINASGLESARMWRTLAPQAVILNTLLVCQP